MIDLPEHGSMGWIRQWVFAICVENPVIQWRIQVAAFIPLECFWKKVRPSREITFVVLLLVSLFNH